MLETATAPSRVSEAGAVPPSLRRAVPFVVVLVLLSVAGLPYYGASLASRVRNPWHAWLRPSGLVGQTAGIVALLLFMSLWLYPLRKRWRVLGRVGGAAGWLDLHITIGVIVPLLAAVHAGWRFTGLIGMGYLAMVIVSLSGFVGRYLYVRIPRRRDGLELSMEEIRGETRGLQAELAAATGFAPEVVSQILSAGTTDAPEKNLFSALVRMVRNDFMRRRGVRRLRRTWARSAHPVRADQVGLERKIAALARREMALAQQVQMLDVTGKAFRWWHAAHLPFALTAAVALLVHVAVVITVGESWLR